MIKAYKFGLLDPIAGFDDAAIEVLYLRNKLWNSLVELEREHREKYRSMVLNADPELAALQSQVDEINLKREDLITQKKKLRASVRSKNVDTAGIDAAIKNLLLERQALNINIKSLRTSAKEAIKQEAKELDLARYKAVRALSNNSGLWWGNSESVIDAYDKARVKAIKENAELQFHRFDGTGQLRVRQSGGFTAEQLESGQLTFAKIESLPASEFAHLSDRGKRSKARHLLTMTINTFKDEKNKKARHQVTWPIVLHRDYPHNGLIKLISVNRKRVGDRFFWSCTITFDIPEESAPLSDHPSTAACGVDLGFRLVPDGIRVATLVDTKEKVVHYCLPKAWLNDFDHVEKLQSEISSAGVLCWAALRQYLSSLAEYPESIREKIHNLLKAGDKTPIRGMRFLHKQLVADDNGELLPEAKNILAQWLVRIRRPSTEMHHLRHKLLNRRRDLYRNIAHEIASQYVMVNIEDLKLKDLVIVKREDGSDNALHQAARDNRKRAALFELNLFIQQACVKSGAILEKKAAAYSTITCSSCGALNDSSKSIYFTCKKCHKLHDQDDNAARNFLQDNYVLSHNHDFA